MEAMKDGSHLYEVERRAASSSAPGDQWRRRFGYLPGAAGHRRIRLRPARLAENASMALNSELARIAEQLRRSFEGEAWHGPSVLEALGGVSPDEANQHPITDAHSIWELAR